MVRVVASAPQTGVVLLGTLPALTLTRVRNRGRLLGSLGRVLAVRMLGEKGHRVMRDYFSRADANRRVAIGGARKTPVKVRGAGVGRGTGIGRCRAAARRYGAAP